MAGAILERPLSAACAVRFAVAGQADDPAIRRLLRNNPMPGAVTLSFEREPDYFLSGGRGGADDQTILAFENERLVGMGRCSTRQRYLDGRIQRVSYLGELRLDSTAQGRFDILRRGYRFFRGLHSVNPPDFSFTSISADNWRSMRLLERGLPGLPDYRFIGRFVTVLIPVPRRARTLRRLEANAERQLAAEGLFVTRGSKECAAEIATCLNAHGRHHNLATFWTADQLLSLERAGLPLDDFHLLKAGRLTIGAAALWDQRCFRQTVIRAYSGRLGLARPWANLLARLLDRPRLLAAPFKLAHAFVSPLAIPPERPELVVPLVEVCLPQAARRGVDFLTLGFAASDPRLVRLRRRFPCREYGSRLYQVSWQEEESPSATVQDRRLFPEVALL